MLKTCKHCGIVDKKHICPHKPKRIYQYNRTDKKVYATRRWQNKREQILDDYNYICLWSMYIDGELKEANEVHHIVELLEDDSLAYEDDNLIPIEFYQHKYVHELYKKDKKGIQNLLRLMIDSYRNGDRTLGKYRGSIPPRCEILY